MNDGAELDIQRKRVLILVSKSWREFGYKVEERIVMMVVVVVWVVQTVLCGGKGQCIV